jgi:hypothetical protein
MAMNVVSQAGSKLENQFLVNALIPTAVFLPVVGFVVLHSIWGFTRVVDWYLTRPQIIQVALPVAALAAVWFVASIVGGQWLFIVQVFEGYPLIAAWSRLVEVPIVGRICRRLGIPGSSGQLYRRTLFQRQMEADPTFDAEFEANFDTVDPYVLPTSLGNILNAAEQYPKHRYGIDSIVFWTRLAMLLPEYVQREMESLISRYQLPLVIAAWGMVLWCLSILPALCGHVGLFQVVLAGGWFICYFGYRMSLRSAGHYGIALRAAFDVHRQRLAETWPSLEGIGEERVRFHRLRDFVVRGRLTRAPPPPPPEKPGLATRPKQPSAWDRAHLDSWRPRLSSLFFGLSVACIWLGSWFIESFEGQYVVTTEDVRAYQPLAGVTSTLPRTRQRFVDEFAATELTDRRWIASRPLESGAIVSKSDVVEVDADGLGGQPTRFVELPARATEVRQLDLRPGMLVEVLLVGRAAYRSDPDCRHSEAGGAPRRVRAQVMSIAPANSAQRGVVVGVPENAAPMLACYGANRTSIVRALPEAGR